MKILEVKIQKGIQFACRRAIKGKLWDDTADTPKGMCPGFTLNMKCARNCLSSSQVFSKLWAL